MGVLKPRKLHLEQNNITTSYQNGAAAGFKPWTSQLKAGLANLDYHRYVRGNLINIQHHIFFLTHAKTKDSSFQLGKTIDVTTARPSDARRSSRSNRPTVIEIKLIL